jgi:UDP-N-acetylglucosamine 2-epimerase (hydrolysing)
MKKRIVFITGTRADFGKIKPLIMAVENSGDFELSIFATGMHPLSKYGYTIGEVYKTLPFHKFDDNYTNIYTFINQFHGEPMEQILANTISGFSRYVREFKPNMIVVHGDRIEAMAGAIVGALRNIIVAHIEGGELSGTIDESIRHSISKLAHVHFVANEEAADRLKKMGENPDLVFPIGSPDIDIMLSPNLPKIDAVKKHYEINFDNYAIAIYHPVTTDIAGTLRGIKDMVGALLKSGKNYVVIAPNNDEGSDCIFEAYEQIRENPKIRFFPSLRFEYFLTLMKNAEFMIGNSSAGIREAPIYGVPSINLGSRQNKRFSHQSILNVSCDEKSIIEAISKIKTISNCPPCTHFGKGKSITEFMAVLKDEKIWNNPIQKSFYED